MARHVPLGPAATSRADHRSATGSRPRTCGKNLEIAQPGSGHRSKGPIAVAALFLLSKDEGYIISRVYSQLRRANEAYMPGGPNGPKAGLHIPLDVASAHPTIRPPTQQKPNPVASRLYHIYSSPSPA
ncbi:hypothetical protein PGT21_034917 [Puccinia graminis f. sp. tritici]|uniref:Uncharacterized protein n=1 Tax=Puccinia graminis f. sp. tritici TaxID=56615 RepID=A0A5B0Q016_PUCGR|nr:hypothetical protein PGT21_034917 [Puccinia graminis f. sp. tritici]KAA1126376.1 hypothetical protein PGTUg99_029888 [Puccinia graminis f. sp. tritici]